MCIHHSGGAGVDPNAVGQVSRSGLSHKLAEMDSLPAQSVRPRLKRSPRRPATPQPLIWIVCVIWIAKRPADRLVHNSKEQAERAAYLGVNSLYFPCNGAHPHRPLSHNAVGVIRRLETEETTPIDVTSCRFKHSWLEVFCNLAGWFSSRFFLITHTCGQDALVRHCIHCCAAVPLVVSNIFAKNKVGMFKN